MQEEEQQLSSSGLRVFLDLRFDYNFYSDFCTHLFCIARFWEGIWGSFLLDIFIFSLYISLWYIMSYFLVFFFGFFCGFF